MVVKQKLNERGARIDQLLCGVDLGGTKIVVAFVDGRGVAVEREEIRNHQTLSGDEITARIADAVARLTAKRQIDRDGFGGIGVGTSGHVDRAAGRIIINSQLPTLADYRLRDALAAATGVEVRVDNDANAQAYAEFRFGAARGFANVVFVTVSTGIGAGIVIDGRLYHGVTGTAGEVGHAIVDPTSPYRCGCGNYGCLMGVASGYVLPQVVRHKLSRPGVDSSIDIAGLSDREINGELIAKALAEGDALAREIVTEYADYLGIGLYNIFQTLNPDVIVLGGGLTNWGEEYVGRVRWRFYTLGATMMREPTEIRLAELQADAAVVGAASLLLEPV